MVTGVGDLTSVEGETETAVAQIFEQMGVKWLAIIVYIGGFLGITTAAYTDFISQVRTSAAVANDGLMFAICGRFSRRTNIPTCNVWINCFLLSVIAFVANLDLLSKVISLSNLMIYSLVNCVCMSMRYRPLVNG